MRLYSFSSKVNALIQNGKLKLETAQQEAINTLSSLSHTLNSQESSAWFRPPTPKGVYIHGSVGSGKTMLMDMFFNEVQLKQKERHHFNEFMLSFHSKMKQHLQIDSVLKSFDCKLLCLDEFQVTDIADAMILRRLLIGLHQNGTTIVTTSNRHPDELYLNGIQRQSFLPCIEHIKRHMHVINLSSEQDFRTMTKNNVHRAVPKFNEVCKDPRPIELSVSGRKLLIPSGQIGVACQFEFFELFACAHSAADFIAICQNFPLVYIEDLPLIGVYMRDEIRRLITFIDICYEYKTKLRFGGSILNQLHDLQRQLNSDHDETFALNRTISRLCELVL